MVDRVRLVAFDLDGTLLRGETVCEALARGLGRIERMRELERATTPQELRAAREEMARWYADASAENLTECLPSLSLAPGVAAGFERLRRHRIRTAIVSITWEFAVEWYAQILGVDHFVGTGLSPGGRIEHFWPEDKPIWLEALAAHLALPMTQVAAVGDSAGDIAMLNVVGRPYFVGPTLPETLRGRAEHCPGAGIDDLARRVFSSAPRRRSVPHQ